LCHVDHLLDNDHEINNYTTAITKYGSENKHISSTTIELEQKNGAFLWTAPRCFMQGK
jgi:hypothetical protein